MVRALTVPGYAWAHHPAALMWKGYEEALGRYGIVCCEAWTERGFGDTCAATIATDLRAAGVGTLRTQDELAAAGALPPWLEDEDLLRSHRSALVRKDPDLYRPEFPDVPDDLPYVWPVRSPAVVEAERRRAEAAVRRARAGRRAGAGSMRRRRGVGAAGRPRRRGRRGAATRRRTGPDPERTTAPDPDGGRRLRAGGRGGAAQSSRPQLGHGERPRCL